VKILSELKLTFHNHLGECSVSRSPPCTTATAKISTMMTMMMMNIIIIIFIFIATLLVMDELVYKKSYVAEIKNNIVLNFYKQKFTTMLVEVRMNTRTLA
jgi:hypothetical protein